MKKNVLKGVNIVFSSVIPLGQIPQRADIWRQAESFGAICSTELSTGVTHVVAAKVRLKTTCFFTKEKRTLKDSVKQTSNVHHYIKLCIHGYRRVRKKSARQGNAGMSRSFAQSGCTTPSESGNAKMKPTTSYPSSPTNRHPGPQHHRTIPKTKRTSAERKVTGKRTRVVCQKIWAPYKPSIITCGKM